MGAKYYVILGCLMLNGCAGWERLAPPGIIKYEDLAKDTPPNPEIEARIEARRTSKNKGYPVLSEQPDAAPEAMPEEERLAALQDLEDQRDALDAALTEARAETEAERQAGFLLPGEKSKGERSIEDTRAALDKAIAEQAAAAAKDPKAPTPPPVQN